MVPWSDPVGEVVLEALGPPGHWTWEQGRTLWRPPRDGEHWSRALVVLDGGVPVAAAGALHPRLHPAHEWAYVEVVGHRRRQGIGSLAVAELRRTLPDGARPWKSKVRAAGPGSAFAARHGMTRIQRTRMIRVTGVPPASLSAQVLVRAGLDDVALSAWRDFYVAGHDWDPPADVGPEVWRDLLADVRTVALTRDGDSGTVTGIALVLPHGDELRCTGGALRRDDPAGPRIARDLLVAVATALDGAAFVVDLDDWMHEVEQALAAGPLPEPAPGPEPLPEPEPPPRPERVVTGRPRGGFTTETADVSELVVGGPGVPALPSP